MTTFIKTSAIATLTLVAALTLNSCGKSNGAETAPSDVFTVKTGSVAMAPVAATMRATGTLEGIREATINSETNGRILSVNVNNGSRVGAGSALVTVDNELKSIAVEQAEAQTLAAEAALEKAKIDLGRSNELSKTGASTKSQTELAELQVKSYQAQLKAASSATSFAKRQLSDATVKAPFAGVVAMRFVNQGELLNSGNKVAMLVDDSKMKLKIGVGELDIPLLKIGDGVRITVDAIPGKTIEGKIITIANKSDAARSYTVEVELPNNDKSLKSGMFARAEIKREVEHDAITAPTAAVINNGSRTQIFVVDEKGIAHLRGIKIGTSNPEQTEILDGLKPGDVVVTFGQSQLKDGAKVKAN